MSQSEYCVVVGSLNIDLLVTAERLPRKGESVLGTRFAQFPGGKGANQAVQLARLGMNTYIVGRVGGDDYAQYLINNLEAAGVKLDYLIRDKSIGTGKGCIFAEVSGDNLIIVVPEANMKWSDADIENAQELIRGARAVILQLEIPLEIVNRTIELAHESQVLTVLNPAPARKLPRDLLQNVDLLVPNETEASFLTGISVVDIDSAIKAARILRSRGPKLVTVTMGSYGSVTDNGEEIIHTPAFPITAIDVTAAGDSFCASLAYGLIHLNDLRVALRFANASGAITVTRMGAQPSLPTLDEICQFLNQ